jgi:uncharacterized membrane protein
MNENLNDNRDPRSKSKNEGIVWGAGVGIIFSTAVGYPAVGLVMGAGAGLMLRHFSKSGFNG